MSKPFGSERRGVERKDAPHPVEVRFFLARHSKAEDFAGLEEELSHADIYVPERNGWTEETRSLYQKLCDGRMTANEICAHYNWPEGSPFALEARLLYNSKKIITFVDEPRAAKTTGLHSKLLASRDVEIQFLRGNFDQAVDTLRKNFSEFVELNSRREQHMVAQIAATVGNITKTFPKLKNKAGPVSMLVFLGAAHAPVATLLESKKVPSIAAIKVNNRVDSMEEQQWSVKLLKMLQENRLEEVTPEMYARAVMNQLLCDLLVHSSNNDKKVQRAAFIIAGRLSEAEIRATAAGFKEAQLVGQTREGQWRVYGRSFRALGIDLPRNEEQLDRFLSQHDTVKA